MYFTIRDIPAHRQFSHNGNIVDLELEHLTIYKLNTVFTGSKVARVSDEIKNHYKQLVKEYSDSRLHRMISKFIEYKKPVCDKGVAWFRILVDEFKIRQLKKGG